MTIHRKSHSPLLAVLIAVVLVLVLLIGFMVFTIWQDSQQVFQDLTIELGTTELQIERFLTPLGNPKRASFVTDPSLIDLTKVGRTSLTLKHGTQKAVVNLIIEDTTPPAAGFLAEYSANVSEPLPQAGALVSNIVDHSQVRVYYTQPPEIPQDYSDLDMTIVVEDTSGNAIQGHCILHFTGWLRESCTVELGSSLTPEMLLTDPDKDSGLLKDVDLTVYAASLGQHLLTVTSGNTSAECTIIVEDTTPPTLELNNIQLFPGETAELSDFVKSAEDLSGTPKVEFSTDLPDFDTAGSYPISITATDSSGNTTKKDAFLWISEDRTPPEIVNASKEMVVSIDSTPDFMEDVYAEDDEDGQCDVSVDTSGLDLSKEGTYTIIYYSTDKSGNTVSCERTVHVE